MYVKNKRAHFSQENATLKLEANFSVENDKWFIHLSKHSSKVWKMNAFYEARSPKEFYRHHLLVSF